MLILKYTLGVILFYGVFLLGKAMIENNQRWAGAFSHGHVPSENSRNVFIYAGRIFQVIALIWGFLDAVSVLVFVF